MKVMDLEEAKEYLKENYTEGIDCPCCGQLVKLYNRKLNSGMATTLIRLYRHHKHEYVNVKSFLREESYQNNHDWTLLRYWKLIEEKANEDTSKRSSGIWRITDYGLQFIRNQVVVRSHVLIYNTELKGFSDTTISIKEALGNNFDYTELMGDLLLKSCNPSDPSQLELW